MHSTWNALRLWINEQENSEILTGQPAALTPNQRHAIGVLVPSATQRHASSSGSEVQPSAPPPAPVPALSGPVVDPGFDNADWVSRLLHHIQGNAYNHPTWEYREYRLFPKTPTKYGAVCWVPHLDASFPNEQYGFMQDEAPCFSTKKEAKHYAAMCAIRCVNDLLSPPAQSTTKTPVPHHPTPKIIQPKIGDPENTNGVPLTQGGPSPTLSGSDTDHKAPLGARKKQKQRVEGDELNALRQVPDLCAALGMRAPQFLVTPNGNDANYFDVRPSFSDAFTNDVPSDLGVVRGILTKKAAKEASAEKVLEWLKDREREREREYIGLSTDY